MGKQMNVKKTVFTAVMWILALMMLYPFIMMIAISFRPSGQAYQPLFSPGIIHTLRNYNQVLGHPNFLDWYRNIPIHPMPYGQAMAMLFLIEAMDAGL